MSIQTLATLRERWALAFGGVLLVAVFLLDLRLPPGSAVGVGYVAVILLGLWVPYPRYPLVAAAASSTAGAAALLIGRGRLAPAVMVSQLIVTSLVWLTAWCVVRCQVLQRTARAQVKELEDFKYALDQAAIVATTDVRGRITYVNDTFCEISKYSREELIGQDHRLVNSALHPPEFIRELWRTIASGRIWRGEIRNRAKDGTHYWVSTTIVPFVDARGRPYRYTAIRSDITQQKAVEAQLRNQESLTRLGQMAAVVAHEVKNPLAGVRGAIEVICSRRSRSDPEAAIMRDIVQRIDALNDLLQDLLVFARPSPPQFARIEITALLRDAAAAVSRDPAHAAVAIIVQGAPVTLLADGTLLHAAFFNLILNASQAMNGRGGVTITVASEDDHVKVAVRDTGPGIPEAIREKVFEPFFTTKARGGGLGLAIAARSISLHGGSVSIECPAAGGTVVSVGLPVREQKR